MLTRISHIVGSNRSNRSGGQRVALRVAMMLSLALVVACSGGSDDRGPDDGQRDDRPGDENRSGDDQGDFQRAPDGNIPPISAPPTLGNPTATPPPGTDPGSPANPDAFVTPSSTAISGSVVTDERVYSCSIDGEHDTLGLIQSTLAPVVPENQTVISIDGDLSDWVGRPTVAVDPPGDAEMTFPDFGEVRAFVNENALYLTAEVSESSAKFDSFEIYGNDESRNLFFGWSPESEYGWAADVTDEWIDIGSLKRSNFALGSAFEARIDLRDIGSPESLTINKTQIMGGECCGDTWRAVELFEIDKPIPSVVEVDPEWRLTRIGGASEASLMLATPDTRTIDVEYDAAGERAMVTGLAGAVPPNTQVLVGNLELNDFIMLGADINGAFQADVAAVEGTHVLIKQDTTNTFIREDRGTFSENMIAPGVMIQIPVTPAAEGVAIAGGARPCCGSEGIAPFAVSGVLERDHVNEGDRVHVSGTVTVFAEIESRPSDQSFELQMTLLGDAGGRQVGRAGKFISPFLTSTGLPIERTLGGSPVGRIDLGQQQLRFDFDGRHWTADFDFDLEIPDGARTGTYGLLAENLWGLSDQQLVPDSDLRAFDIVTRDDNQYRPTLATIMVGDPNPMRLTTTLLADQVDDGARGGLIAREDFGLFDIAGRSSSRHEPVVQRLDPYGDNWTYRFDPYAPMLDVVDRALPGAPALNPSLGVGSESSLKVTVQRPDGGVDVIGPAPLTRYGVKSPRTAWNDTLNPGGGVLREIPQLMGDGDTFAYEFPSDGDYIITLNGRVNDTQGNVHGICGTYDLTVASHLEIETSLLPTTPFEIGNSIAPTVSILPGVPADIAYTVTHVASDGVVDQQTFRGTANRYGWWDGNGEIYQFKRDGEYRVDIDTRYASGDGRLWVGRMRFGGVVATPDAPIVVHGRRGPDGQTELAPVWAFEESFISEDSAHWQFPYFSGDVLWGDTEPGPGQAVVTHLSVQSLDDEHPLVSRAVAVAEEYGVSESLPLDVAIRADQMPLVLGAENRSAPGSHPDELSLWSYTYGSAQRPGVRVREIIQGDDVSGVYWRFGDTYHGQLGNGPEGDLPGDFKFFYGGAVIRDPAAGEGIYAIYGSSWVHTVADDPLASRLFPPFQGNAGGPNGGPLFTTHGREIDVFFTPLGVKPGAVLETGDTFRMSGPVMPTLPSLVEYTVVAPDGSRRQLGGRANAIGYFYDPADDFVVDQPGQWTVEVTVTHDGQTSAGPVQSPFPTGGVLSPDGKSFSFVVADPSVDRTSWTTNLSDLPVSEWLEGHREGVFITELPDGWVGDEVNLVVRMPGNVLIDEQLQVIDGAVTWRLVGEELRLIATNFDTGSDLDVETGGGLYDTVTLTMYAEGVLDGIAAKTVATFVTHGVRVPESPDLAEF